MCSICKNHALKDILVQQSQKSMSTYRVSAVAFDKKGDMLGAVCNSFRRDNVKPGKYSGYHAETKLIHRYGDKIKTIVIARTGGGGNLLPIDPCEKCAHIAKKMGIKIISIK